MPVTLSPDAPLFTVPTGLLRILNRDLAAASIPKHDERGRTVAVHAMRYTFGTHLSKGGVSPRTAQAAMRHSSVDLTMTTYTDPRLLDVAGAMDALPSLPLDDGPRSERAQATGTDPSSLVPLLVPTTGNHRIREATADNLGGYAGRQRFGVSVAAGSVRQSMTDDDEMESMGLEPTTSALRTQRSPN